MDADFWHEKWQRNQIGFHENEPNPLFVAHFEALALPKNSRVFLPLCGKTSAIEWLLEQGYRVVGVELSEIAIIQLFDELGIIPNVTTVGNVACYHADQIDMCVGNLFDVTADIFGSADAILDRAALVALPEEMRKKYTQHLRDLTGNAPQLLITFEYDSSVMTGPPFSISAEEVAQHYKQAYELNRLQTISVDGGFNGKSGIQEAVWLLTPTE